MKFMKNKKINQKNLNTFNNRYNSKIRSKNSKMEQMPNDVIKKFFEHTPNSINFSETSVRNNLLYKKITKENKEKLDILIEDLLDKNVTKETLLKNLKIITKDNGTNGWDKERINIFYWNLSKLNLTKLPESFINLKIGGDLYLSANNLKSLPKSFGYNLEIGGDLVLSGNQLESLPESFGNIVIGGDLWLSGNNLKSLPDNFVNIKIGNSLHLEGNQLKTLPKSFGSLTIGGDLDLSHNQLEELPESFGKIEIGGNLDLSQNQLEKLPESFGKLDVPLNLYLNDNPKLTLPQSFGNISFGFELDLSNNPNINQGNPKHIISWSDWIDDSDSDSDSDFI